MKKLSINSKFLKLFLFISLFSINGLNNAASFNCAKAYDYAEKMICSHPDLSAKDDALEKVYSQARSITGNSQDFKNIVKQNCFFVRAVIRSNVFLIGTLILLSYTIQSFINHHHV